MENYFFTRKLMGKISSMKWIFLFLFCNVQVFGQTNLVPNPSFEQVYSSYTCGSSANEDNYEAYWADVYNWQMPDPTWSCIKTPATADIMCKGVQNITNFPAGIRTGDHAVHLICEPNTNGWMEYVVVKLDNPLPANQHFYYEFYYKMLDNQGINHDKIGAHLFNEKPKQCAGVPGVNGKLNHETIYPKMYSKYPKPDGEWVRAFGYFDTWNQGDLQWAAFGCFDFDDNIFLTKLFIDDIKIIQVNYNLCPENWLFDNMAFDQGLEIYQANNNIVIGNGADPNVIDGDVFVKSGSELRLKAGNGISILPGFYVEPGGLFNTEIAGCDPYPCAPPQFKSFDPMPCGSNVVLDVLSSVNNSWKIRWSPAQYVDDPTEATPTFIPPAGSGTINMVLEITDLCGISTTKTFSVPYNAAPLQSPSLSITGKHETKYDLSFDIGVLGTPAEVQITIAGTGYHFTKTIYPSSPYHWTSSNQELISCGVYTVNIVSTNRCSGESVSQTMVWDRTAYLNFVSLTNYLNTNHPVNNKLYAYCAGADYYETKVYNSHGNLIETESGRVLTSPAPIFTARGNYSDGTYYYTVRLYNCNGQSETKGQYFTWYNSSPPPVDSLQQSEKTLAIAPEEKPKESMTEIKMFPNPSNGIFKLLIVASEKTQNFNVLITDVQGKEVYQRTVQVNGQQNFDIDIRDVDQGVYIIKVFNDNISYTDRLIKF